MKGSDILQLRNEFKVSELYIAKVYIITEDISLLNHGVKPLTNTIIYIDDYRYIDAVSGEEYKTMGMFGGEVFVIPDEIYSLKNSIDKDIENISLSREKIKEILSKFRQ